MTPTYYRLWYRLDHADGYLIWFSDDSDDTDGIVIQPGGIVPELSRSGSAVRLRGPS
jgi:hypothetical protein